MVEATTENLASALQSAFTMYSVAISSADLKILYEGAIKDITRNHDKNELTSLYQYNSSDWCLEFAMGTNVLQFYTLWDAAKKLWAHVQTDLDITSTFIGHITNDSVSFADILVYPTHNAPTHETSANTTIDVTNGDQVLIVTVLPSGSNTTREEFDSSVWDNYRNVTSVGEAGLKLARDIADIHRVQQLFIGGTAYVLSVRIYRDVHGRLRATPAKYLMSATHAAMTNMAHWWDRLTSNGQPPPSGTDSIYSGLVRVKNLHTWFSAWVTAPDEQFPAQRMMLTPGEWRSIAEALFDSLKKSDMDRTEYALQGEIYKADTIQQQLVPIGQWELGASSVVDDEL